MPLAAIPAAVAIPSAISAGTSLIGGILGSNAASSAASQQQAAAKAAQQQLLQLLGQYNPQIQTAAQQGAQAVNAAAGTAAQNITGAAGGANQLLAPFLQTGTQGAQSLAQFMAPGGMGMQNFTAADMQTLDPGYQFRIDQANKALQATAAAQGGALGGGTLSALNAQSQNLASNEMQNAFNRFTTQQQNRFSNLMGMAGMGMSAGQQSGANLLQAATTGGGLLTNAAQFGATAQQQAAQQMAANALATGGNISNLITGAGAAGAAGTMGSANALSGALGGIGNAALQAGNMYQQQQMLQNLGAFMNPSLGTSPYYNMSRFGTPPFVGTG